MLEKVNLEIKLEKAAYKARMPALRDRLYDLQKTAWDSNTPVVIVFEGWGAAGRNEMIQKLTRPLDPRGYKIHAIRPSRTYEKKLPWLWRYWMKLPGYGELAIFDKSWYTRVLDERVQKIVRREAWEKAYGDIVDFERTLADDGCIFVKFWLHIGRKEQKKRFKKIRQDPFLRSQIEPEDWLSLKKYDHYYTAVEEMLERTYSEWGPWTILPCTDARIALVQAYQTIIQTMETRLPSRPNKTPPPPADTVGNTNSTASCLPVESMAEQAAAEERQD